MTSPQSNELGPLRDIPHEVLVHVFPGLPQATVMALSRDSSMCRAAAQQAIPRKRAALRASIQNGCLSATHAQMRVLRMFLQRFAECRHIFTNEPTESPVRNYTIIGPQGRALLPEVVVSQDAAHPRRPLKLSTFDYVNLDFAAILPSEGSGPSGGAASANHPLVRVSFRTRLHGSVEGGDREHEPNMFYCMEFWFVETNTLCTVSQIRWSGMVVPGLLYVRVHECKEVELAQALTLTFQQFCPGAEVDFNGPVRSLRDCAVLVAGCPVIKWRLPLGYLEYTGNAEYLLHPNGHNHIDNMWAPEFRVWQRPCPKCGGQLLQQCV
eukprot:jgi/Botrbrau1/17742/Bobra.0127s0007.1